VETQNIAAKPESEATLIRLRKLLVDEKDQLNDGNTPFPFTDKMGKDFWGTYPTAGG
jgi:hypothetical protein